MQEDKPQEPLLSSTGHPLPRRASPENSITLRHHQLARDVSLKASRGSAAPPNQTIQDPSPPRRASSGESHETGQSDANKWFDESNENPTANFGGNAMDVDPPFFQKESDSSNEDKPYLPQAPAPRSLSNARSSSADDYRSVIDDLTVEIQKLKEELKRYKPRDPDMLRKDRLFEIKMHGLPKRKKRELEATLREFAASLGNSPETSSSQRNPKSSRHATRERMYSGSGSNSMSLSKHASSSSGSHTRPVDSAYASMSTGAGSSGTSLNRPQGNSRFKTNDQKVENYLREIPEGLYPRIVPLTEKEKKKLVVRRLEQIFTGKISGKHARRNKSGDPPPGSVPRPAQATPGHPSPQRSSLVQQPKPRLSIHSSSIPNPTSDPMREARILPQEHQSGQTEKNSRSRDMGSASNSNEDQTESGANGSGNGSGASGTNPSPPMAPPPEQRPTKPRDLDPDRAQIPSENMEYIRHLGLVPPELLPHPPERSDDVVVRPDEEGWVYLNLLCNMAQLHMMNVTPDFVRNAVIDLSAKFQLSPDGRKIRWRGGPDGTKFSSDSSGGHSQRSPDTDEAENTKIEHRKRQKTGRSSGDSWSPANGLAKFGPQASVSTESFHYKPLLLHQPSSSEQSSPGDGTLSSFGPLEESNADSRWGRSGSGASIRRKRRRDGAIIYYSGAPFCTDLSGDPGDRSPTTNMLSSSIDRVEPQVQFARPIPFRSASGSSIIRRPLSDADLGLGPMSKMQVDDGGVGVPELMTDSGDESSELNMEFPWSDAPQSLEVHPLEPCGLSGVLPEDHFMVVVTTRRSKLDAYEGQWSKPSEETTESIINRLAAMSTSPPRPFARRLLTKDEPPKIQVEYLSGRIRRMEPVPLPPPAIFFPPFSADSCSDDGYESDGDDEFNSSEELMSRQANPHQSDDYPEGVDLTSADEVGEEPDDDADMSMNDEPDSSGLDDLSPQRPGPDSNGSQGSIEAIPGTLRGRSNSANAEGMLPAGGSSVATAGGVESDDNSSPDESS